ncbi:MAG: endonuclease/exonuclease/phosphatase family protein [Polyangiaceae bacterium]|nr:endonuclease/exonuclease/phosphatase family protein [Polyangiaceae bacterium]
MTLRIATYNLKDFFSARTPGEAGIVEAKIANVASELRRARADVVALQEVGSDELVNRLVTRELADQNYGAPVMGTRDKRGIGCAILSRLPVLWSQVHTRSYLPFPKFCEGDPEPFADRIPLRRGVVHVRVESPKLGEIDVITAHFKSGRGVPLKTQDGQEIHGTVNESPRGCMEALLRSFVQRSAEAIFVRSIVDDIFGAFADHGICVLGDLNDRADSMPVRIVRGTSGRGALESEHLRACGTLVPDDERFSCFHEGLPILIDHVLVSERLFRFVRSFHIQNEKLRYHGSYLNDAPLTSDSDHALCVAEFG